MNEARLMRMDDVRRRPRASRIGRALTDAKGQYFLENCSVLGVVVGRLG